MDRAQDRSPDVERAAQRLAAPRQRAELACKRALDVVLALTMLVALLPVLIVVAVLLAGAGEGWLDRRVRLRRDGRPVPLARFRALPGGLGRGLEGLGACELPLLVAVVRGRGSFVGPRLLAPGTRAGHTGPRRLMAPGLTGPAQQFAQDADAAARLDDEYVADWSLWFDLKLLLRVQRAHQTVSNSSS